VRGGGSQKFGAKGGTSRIRGSFTSKGVIGRTKKTSLTDKYVFTEKMSGGNGEAVRKKRHEREAGKNEVRRSSAGLIGVLLGKGGKEGPEKGNAKSAGGDQKLLHSRSSKGRRVNQGTIRRGSHNQRSDSIVQKT